MSMVPDRQVATVPDAGAQIDVQEYAVTDVIVVPHPTP
jgi:hypothetical protein